MKMEYLDCLTLLFFAGDPTLSRHKGININELALHTKIAVSPSGEMWRGKWQGNEIVAKILALRECSPRVCRDFNEEFPRLRYCGFFNPLRVAASSENWSCELSVDILFLL